MRVIIRFVEKPIPYYAVSGRGWADVATTPEGAVKIAALHVGLAEDDSLALRIAWEDVPEDFAAPDLMFMEMPVGDDLQN